MAEYTAREEFPCGAKLEIRVVAEDALAARAKALALLEFHAQGIRLAQPGRNAQIGKMKKLARMLWPAKTK